MPIDQATRRSHANVLWHNLLEHIGHCGTGLFGSQDLVEENTLRDICITKGDCGAIRTYGRTSLTSSAVHDTSLNRNMVDTVPGNIDRASAGFATLFGFYIDNYSRNILVSGNTIVNTSRHAIVYQASTGAVRDNLAVIANDRLPVTFSSDGVLTELSGNTLVALKPSIVVVMGDPTRLSGSDNNVFFNPYSAQCVDNGTGTSWTLAQWRTFSGQDKKSVPAW